ncbi:hypothetical protein GCM10009784_27270 [Arthrobacter parietis]|uniref:Uncharacterized protein n=1 Tax=Arthrobacter parietis TaxID=271434 RepID=A0ABP5MQV1_9MICC
MQVAPTLPQALANPALAAPTQMAAALPRTLANPALAAPTQMAPALPRQRNSAQGWQGPAPSGLAEPYMT